MKALTIAAVLGWAVALYCGNELLRANARAEAMRAAFDATTAAYDSTIAAATLRIQARDDSIRALTAARAGTVARADSVAEARPEAPDLAPYLPPELAGVWEAWRSSVVHELALLREALDLSDRQIAALERTIGDQRVQLAATQARLTAALDGWEASERARRPSVITWATRALAVVGTVVIVKEGYSLLTP